MLRKILILGVEFPAHGGPTTPPLALRTTKCRGLSFVMLSTHAHYIPAVVMRKKHQEFIDLKQGGRFVHDYSKQFNYLAQYVPNQVDTDEKKNDRFMIGLSTKLQECLVLNTGGTFLEFISNIMIADDVIRAHKETKKRKDVAAPSGSAPLKYRWAAPKALPPPPPVRHLPAPPTAGATSGHISFNCGRSGHFA
jgi:hypothetical protein